VQCSIDWDKEDVYRAILKEIGASIAETTTDTKTGSKELKAEVKGEGGVPLFAKASGGVSSGASRTTTDATGSRFIEFDPASATDVVRVLEEGGFDRFIVLEDFHYLDPDVQRALASDLKTFFERSSISFIIVGVWLEANRLVVYNGDLAGGITSIPADTWTEEELAEVVHKGEPLLNLSLRMMWSSNSWPVRSATRVFCRRPAARCASPGTSSVRRRKPSSSVISPRSRGHTSMSPSNSRRAMRT
jgi:hypothetical protein